MIDKLKAGLVTTFIVLVILSLVSLIIVSILGILGIFGDLPHFAHFGYWASRAISKLHSRDFQSLSGTIPAATVIK